MGLAGLTVLVQPDFQRLAELLQRPVKFFGAGLFKEGLAKAGVCGGFLTAMPPADKKIVDLA